MSWLSRFIVFTLIPITLLMVLAPDNWGGAEWLTILGANILGYIEGIITEGSR